MNTLVPRKEAQNILGCRATFIFALLKEGRLTRVKIGGKTFVTSESIRRLISDAMHAANGNCLEAERPAVAND
jgi:hypothetical protein